MPESPDSDGKRRWERPPSPVWTDAVVRFSRRTAIVGVGHRWLSTRLVPFVLAVVVVAPVGLLILPLFVPKFLRTARLRRRFGVRFVRVGERPLARTGRASPDAPSGGSAPSA
jgi:hypothetical protein